MFSVFPAPDSPVQRMDWSSRSEGKYMIIMQLCIAAGHRDREMKPYVQYISMGHISHSPKMILGEVKRGFKTGRLQHFCICKSSTGLRCHLYGVALEVHFATAAQRWNSLFSSSSLQPFAHNAPPPTRQASCNRDGRLTLGVNH